MKYAVTQRCLGRYWAIEEEAAEESRKEVYAVAVEVIQSSNRARCMIVMYARAYEVFEEVMEPAPNVDSPAAPLSS